MNVNFVLLRGLVRQASHWGDFVPLLQEKPWCGRVVCLDLPGAGSRRESESPLEISQYTDTLRKAEAFVTEGGNGPWGLMGISLGGMIAMDWCARFPQDFAHLFLINSSARGLCTPWERLCLTSIVPLAISLLGHHRNPEKREWGILKMACNLRQIDSKLVKRMARLQKDSPISRKTCLRQMMAASRFKIPESKSIATPLLVLSSKKDRLVSSTCSSKIARHFSAPLEEHPQAGHDLPLDDPHWVLDRVGEFMAPKTP